MLFSGRRRPRRQSRTLSLLALDRRRGLAAARRLCQRHHRDAHAGALVAQYRCAARRDGCRIRGRSRAGKRSSLPRSSRKSRPSSANASRKRRRARATADGSRDAFTLFRISFSQAGRRLVLRRGRARRHDRLCRARCAAAPTGPKRPRSLLAEISLFRVPQLSERILPFAVLVGAMSCYLALSRRLELVVARAAGVSAWQFVAPSMIAAFLFGVVATTIYNPLAAVMHERSKRLGSRDDGRACVLGGCAKTAAASGCASAAPTARRSSTPSRAASKARNSAP